MALDDILRSGIALADTITKPIQATVTHKAWIGQTGYGGESYAAPVNRKAIVDLTRRMRTRGDGTVIAIAATIIFLETVPANGTVTVPPRSEPIDDRDVITLPDGRTGPIIKIPDAVVDPDASGRPFFTTAYLGELT